MVNGAPNGKLPASAWAAPRAVRDITIEGNKIYGGLVINGVENLRVKNNRIMEPKAFLQFQNNLSVEFSGNTDHDGKSVPALEKIK